MHNLHDDLEDESRAIKRRISFLEEQLAIAEHNIKILFDKLRGPERYYNERHCDCHRWLPPHPHYEESPYHNYFSPPPEPTIIGDSFDSWAKEVKVDKSQYVSISGDKS